MKKEQTTQFVVKYCTKCKHSWEKSGKYIVIHLGFPTYGVQRKICSYCIKKGRQ